MKQLVSQRDTHNPILIYSLKWEVENQQFPLFEILFFFFFELFYSARRDFLLSNLIIRSDLKT